MATKKKQSVRRKPDGKKKLNGSVDVLAQAFRDVITEAVQNLPTKDDHDSLVSLVGETNEELVSLRKAVDTDRDNTSLQFREINKKLGKIEKLRN